VTLIEVLITIFITSVGLLAVGMMQIIALQSNHESSQRSYAITMAENMISRMRSTPIVNLADYETTVGGTPLSTPSPICSFVATCTSAQKITYDLWQWEQLLIGTQEKTGTNNSGGLVNANGCIDITNNLIEIIVAWDGIGKAKKAADAVTDACGGATRAASTTRRQVKIYTTI